VYAFHARDLQLVMGPGSARRPIRYRVTLDGHAPAESHGVDVDSEGNGTMFGPRLYQLIRQIGPVRQRRFQIEFDSADAEAFAFTFG
jgi:hypothetical protein